jgi:uncharacterized protein YfaT (DUF1175 family)
VQVITEEEACDLLCKWGGIGFARLMARDIVVAQKVSWMRCCGMSCWVLDGLLPLTFSPVGRQLERRAFDPGSSICGVRREEYRLTTLL